VSGNFREPASAPVWLARARLLAALMGGRRYKASELIALGRHDLGWHEDQARNVLAAAEGKVLFESGGVWVRAEERRGTGT